MKVTHQVRTSWLSCDRSYDVRQTKHGSKKCSLIKQAGLVHRAKIFRWTCAGNFNEGIYWYANRIFRNT